MHKQLIGYIAIVIPLFVFSYIMLQIGKQRQIADQHRTYSICLAAHAERSGRSETACANAQDATRTEFMCNQTNHCWLEVK